MAPDDQIASVTGDKIIRRNEMINNIKQNYEKSISKVHRIAFLGTANAYAQTPVRVYDVFTAEYGKIQQDMWDYTSSVSRGKSARKVEKEELNGSDFKSGFGYSVPAKKAFNGSHNSVIRLLNTFRSIISY
jgi:hypothetical protein